MRAIRRNEQGRSIGARRALRARRKRERMLSLGGRVCAGALAVLLAGSLALTAELPAFAESADTPSSTNSDAPGAEGGELLPFDPGYESNPDEPTDGTDAAESAEPDAPAEPATEPALEEGPDAPQSKDSGVSLLAEPQYKGTIVVHTGGVRAEDNSVLPPADGIVYSARQYGLVDGPLYECTTVNGDCTISVPTGRQYMVWAKPPAGADENKNYYQVSDDYYAMRKLGVGGKNSVDARFYQFLTGQVVAGTIMHVSGDKFGTADGNYHDDRRDGDAPNPNKFSGKLALALNNPEAQQVCGQNIALVLDTSESMSSSVGGTTRMGRMKTAVAGFVDALAGTPSKVSIYSFGSTKKPQLLDMSMLNEADRRASKQFTNKLTAVGATNWDLGLSQVGTGYDSVIMLTDGNPTVDGLDGKGTGQFSRFANAEHAMFSANKIKSTGQRLTAIGMGLRGGSEVNLQAISGPQRNLDYYLASDDEFGEVLRNLAQGMCPSSLTVQKQIADADGNIIDNSPEANGWNFTGTSTSPETTIGEFPATSTVDTTTGMTSASYDARAGTTSQLTITEEPGLPGYTLDPTLSTCTVAGVSADLAWSGTSATFTAPAGTNVHCIFVNREPKLYKVTVVKNWVNSIPGDQANITLTDSNGGVSTAPTNGEVVTQTYRAGVPVTVAETLSGNPLKGAYSSTLVCDNGIVPVDGQFTTIEADITCTFTNTNATRKATLTKTWVDGVLGDTAMLTINGDPGKTSKVSAGHTSGTWVDADQTVTKVDIPVGSEVTMAEELANNKGTYDTSWSCGAVGNAPTFMMPNADVHCDVTNTAKKQTLTLEKEVDNTLGGISTADQWTLTATSGATRAINGTGTITDPVGAPDVAAISGNVVAGLTYTLSEGGPSGYTAAAAWVCVETGTQTSVPVTDTNKVTTVAGQDVTCRIVNTALAGTGTISKRALSNVQNADGTWTVRYQVAVTNLSPTSTYSYDLVDELKFGAGIDVLSAVVDSSPEGVVLDGSWTGLAPNTLLASNVQLPAATRTHVYEITVNAAVHAEAQEDENAVCDSGSSDPDAGGFLNKVTLKNVGDGTIDGEAYACEPPKFPDVLKRGHVATQNPDASWNVRYTIEVQNPSGTELQVKLSDDFPSMPAGWTLVGGAWNVAAIAGSPTSQNSAYAPGVGVIWEGRLAAASVYAYSVSGTMMPSAGATPIEKCSTVDGGLENRAVVESGEIVKDDTGCVDPETPPVTVKKDDGSVQQLADGTWQIDYNVAVTNSSSTYATKYTLTDLPDFGTGFTVVGQEWVGTVPVADTAIAASETHRYVYRVIASFDPAVENPELLCKPGDGGAFYNVATVTFPGGTDTDDACGEPRGPEITKVAVAPSAGENGAWNLRYTVRVTNTSGILLAYTATDAPEALPAGVTLTTPWAVTGPGISPSGGGSATLTPGWDGAGQTEIARGMIPSGATHTYTVTASVTLSALVDPEKLKCEATPGSDRTGLWNGSTVSNGVFGDDAEACSTPQTVPVEIEKSDATVTQLEGGAWQLDYTVIVSNQHALPTVYSLEDTPNFAADYDIQSEGWLGSPNVTDVPMPANGNHEYVYRVIATAKQDPVSSNGLACTGPGTGFYNVATVTYPGGSADDAGCGIPAKPVVEKTALQTKNSGSGQWTLAYEVTVTNPSEMVLWYSLTDTPEALPSGVTGGAWALSGPAISAGGTAIVNPLWDGATDVNAATGMLMAGDKHTYTVSRTVTVAPAVDAEVLECTTPGDGGVWNSATVTNGIGGNTDDACAGIDQPGVYVEKTVTSTKQLVDGTWEIAYDVVVTNQSTTMPAVYDLIDELEFGGEINVVDADWSGPTSGVFAAPEWKATLASARELAPHADGAGVETYRVTTHATIDAEGWDNGDLVCLDDGGKVPSGFLNVATVRANGEDSNAVACSEPTPPTIEKRGVSAVQDAQDPAKWTVSYDVTVTPGAHDTFYSLRDQPYFASGITRLSATAQRTDSAVPGEVLPVTEDVEFVTEVPLGAAEVHVYRVVWQVEVTDAFVKIDGVCAGAGTGFFNSATLRVGLVEYTDADCLPTNDRVYPSVTKTARSSAQNPETGDWTVLYDLTVKLDPKGAANPEGLAAKYDLSDQLKFGEGISVRSASWTGAGTGTFADVKKKAVLASGKRIEAGDTHTYAVQVITSVTEQALEEDTTTCLPTGEPGGFLNTGVLTSGGKTTPVAACAEPHFPEVDKTTSAVVDHKDGTWTLSYQIDVTYPATTLVPVPSPVAYDLSDVPELPKGVALVGDWTAAAVTGTPAPTTPKWNGRGKWTIVDGGELTPADAKHSYLVSATVKVTEALESAIGECSGESGVIVWNNATVTSGEYLDTDRDCAPVQVPDVGIEKSASGLGTDGAVEPGDSFDYVLTVTNHGTTQATQVRVTDADIHERLQITGLTVGDGVTWSGAPGYTNGPNNVDLTIDALAIGQSVDVTVSVTFLPAPVGTAEANPDAAPAAPAVLDVLENTACVAMEADSNPNNNCDDADVPVKEISAAVYTTCVADAPRLGWVVTKSKELRDQPIDFLWAPNGATVSTVPGQVTHSQPGGSLKWSNEIAWPGTGFSASGVAIDHPGWRPLAASDYAAGGGYLLPGTSDVMTAEQEAMFVKNAMIVDPGELDFAWQGASSVTITADRELAFDVALPEIPADCASPRHAEVEIEKTASVKDIEAGKSFAYSLETHNVSTDTAADGVVVTDEIPAELKVTAVTWPGQNDDAVFPNWQSCEVDGANMDGYGGTLTCVLFGPLQPAGAELGASAAPTITLDVTVAPDTTVTKIVNTAVVDFYTFGDPEDSGRDSDDATVLLGWLSLTGAALPWAAALLALLAVVCGAGSLILARRRVDEKEVQV